MSSKSSFTFKNAAEQVVFRPEWVMQCGDQHAHDVIHRQHNVCAVCMAVIVSTQVIPNSSGSVLEPYHEMMSSTSEDGRYSVIFYGEKKNIFSGTDADVYLVSLESDPPERWLVCQFKSESRFQLAWEDNDHFWVNRNPYSVEEIIAAPSEETNNTQ